MALVELDSLKPGMKADRDVVEASGQTLLKSGTEITEKHINILRCWGVTHVEIEGSKPMDAEEALVARASPAIIDRAQATCNERFRFVDLSHPPCAEMMRIAVIGEIRLLLETAPNNP